MPTLTIRFERLKHRFAHLNQDIVDSFFQQNITLVKVLDEALENFLLAKHIESKEEAMFVKQPTEPTAMVKNTAQLAPLPNAKQKEEYQFSTANLGGVQSVQFSSECGLFFNAETKMIEGKPSLGGQEIRLLFNFVDGSQQSTTLYINADPRSLWNNIPSQALVKEYWKADSASGAESTPFGNIIAARMRGRSHAHKGTCCDDDFAFGFHQSTGIHFLAVADGAGSAEYSRLGSKLAVNAAKETFFENLNDVSKPYYSFTKLEENSASLEHLTINILGQVVYSAFVAQQKTTNENITAKSLSCTLLLAFTLPLKSGKWFTAAYWVGDGAVAMFNPDNNELFLLGESDGGQYSGETQFLSKAEFDNEAWKARVKMSLSKQAPVLFVMTDGVSDPKFKNDAALGQSEPWAALWAELQEPLSQENPAQALEAWLDFWSVGEHDDRTLAMFIPSTDFAEKTEKLTVCEKGESETQAEESAIKTEKAVTLSKESDVEPVATQQVVENSEENEKSLVVTLQTEEKADE